MAISFEIPERLIEQMQMVKVLAEYVMRPLSRDMDENEHARPMAFIEQMWPFMRDTQKRTLEKLQVGGDGGAKREGPGVTHLRLMMMIEILSWGDAGIYLCLPSAGLGGAAIEAVGTTEQKLRFLTRFAEGNTPVWGAMAMTEPGAGSDTASFRTTGSIAGWIVISPPPLPGSTGPYQNGECEPKT